MIGSARKQIQDALSEAKNPIVCWSGGKDSMLVLHLAREVNKDIPVLVFKDFWDDLTFIQNVIEKWELTAFHYKPVEITLKGDTVVAYYNLAGKPLPVLTDIEYGERCGLKHWNTGVYPKYMWDVTLTGSKRADTHHLVPNLDLRSLTTDEHKLVTPLWNWTDAEVTQTLASLEIEARPDEPSKMCFNCLKGTHAWCFLQQKVIAGVPQFV